MYKYKKYQNNTQNKGNNNIRNRQITKKQNQKKNRNKKHVHHSVFKHKWDRPVVVCVRSSKPGKLFT